MDQSVVETFALFSPNMKLQSIIMFAIVMTYYIFKKNQINLTVALIIQRLHV